MVRPTAPTRVEREYRVYIDIGDWKITGETDLSADLVIWHRGVRIGFVQEISFTATATEARPVIRCAYMDMDDVPTMVDIPRGETTYPLGNLPAPDPTAGNAAPRLGVHHIEADPISRIVSEHIVEDPETHRAYMDMDENIAQDPEIRGIRLPEDPHPTTYAPLFESDNIRVESFAVEDTSPREECSQCTQPHSMCATCNVRRYTGPAGYGTSAVGFDFATHIVDPPAHVNPEAVRRLRFGTGARHG